MAPPAMDLRFGVITDTCGNKRKNARMVYMHKQALVSGAVRNSTRAFLHAQITLDVGDMRRLTYHDYFNIWGKK